MKSRIGYVAALLYCLAPACSSGLDGDGSGSNGKGPDTAAAPSTSAPSVHQTNRVELANGASLTAEEGPDGVMVFGLESREDLSDRVSNINSVEELYRAVAPDRALPESVVAAVERSRSSAIKPVGNLGDLAPKAGIQADLQLDSAVDQRLVQAKEAARNVTSFRNSYCLADKILETDIGENTYYRKNEQCGTERTGAFTHSLLGSNQGYVALYMYRGASTLSWYWKELGAATWILGNSYPVSEGTYRAFWVKTTVDRDFQFRLTDSDGDGFNYAIHNARAQSGEMKETSGNDYYHTLCQCNDSFSIANYVIEHCSINRSESDVQKTARFWCGQQQSALTVQLGRPVPCKTLAVERVSAGKNCGLLEATKECTFAHNCKFECNDICTMH